MAVSDLSALKRPASGAARLTDRIRPILARVLTLLAVASVYLDERWSLVYASPYYGNE
jgi:hypothetical protein